MSPIPYWCLKVTGLLAITQELSFFPPCFHCLFFNFCIFSSLNGKKYLHVVRKSFMLNISFLIKCFLNSKDFLY